MVTSEMVAGDNPEPELRPLHIARKLADAQRLEAVLTAAGINYDVAPETYQGGVIFRSARVGAFFYVVEEDRARAEAVLLENGFRPVK
jgi:hypothetical protein